MIYSNNSQFQKNKGTFGVGRDAPITMGMTHTIKLMKDDGKLGPGRSLRLNKMSLD